MGRGLPPELAPALVSGVGRVLTPTGWRRFAALAKGFHSETRGISSCLRRENVEDLSAKSRHLAPHLALSAADWQKIKEPTNALNDLVFCLED
jgi:hypothetical protein